jgi:hypothetical protein
VSAVFDERTTVIAAVQLQTPPAKVCAIPIRRQHIVKGKVVVRFHAKSGDLVVDGGVTQAHAK